MFSWDVTMLCSFLLALRVGHDWWIKKDCFRLFMFLVFIVFTVGSACMGWLYIRNVDQNNSFIEWIWESMSIAILILLVPVFMKYLYLLAASKGGFYIETGIVLMVIGMMAVLTRLFEMMPFISLISAGAFYFGYDWLLNKHHKF
ncbi:hypothetical protein [Paenibacillus piri]|uniref:Uncharacterized protein n=1 Tax=Paenibacillus piri TaxID=2547395 RepID=A0A4R5KAZ9_9BACL|nr:hypothetical protein [Paenibacillus piri]TDF91307.1 hypothetical protein E1757_32730 [Paenibacillus piri]